MDYKRPDISVIMPIYNCAATIAQAIASLRAQTFEAWELLVIDDASTDESTSLVLSVGDPRIQLIRNDKNQGLAESLNRGIDKANGSFIARMDGDDVAYPERFQQQMLFLEMNRKVDVVGSQMLIFKSSGEAIAVLRPPLTHDKICRAAIAGNFPLYHPTWFGRIGWFRHYKYDPGFRKAQDFELLLRASATSEYANIDKTLMGYRLDSGSIRKRLLTRRFVFQSFAKHFRTNGDWKLFLRGGFMTVGKGVWDLLASVREKRTVERGGASPVTVPESIAWSKVRDSLGQ